MRRLWIPLVCSLALLCRARDTDARPASTNLHWSEPETEVDLVGDVDGTHSTPRKALQDTIWIADWTFDNGASCDDSGWTHVDNHVLFTGDIYWHVETGYTTTTGMAGNSFAVGYDNDVCCESLDGYDNGWYQGIRLTYTGSATLSFDYRVDSEEGYDFLQIETDSLCASYDRVDLQVDPRASAAGFRRVVARASGLVSNGEFVNVPLTNNGPGTHCVYIAFFSDGAFSPCDGYLMSTFGEGAVIDNISLSDASGTRSEDFEDGTLDIGTSVDMNDSAPFGTWARLFLHVTDNDVCTENTTCSWLWTDDTTPTLYNDPSMGFGPGGYVIKGWLDDIIVSPWVSLSSAPSASVTVLQFDLFPGNHFTSSRIVQCWSFRSRKLVESKICVSPWEHTNNWYTLSEFRWVNRVDDMSADLDLTAEEVQIRFRTSDWQWIAEAAPPAGGYVPGPGPYVDHARIGRLVLDGPIFDEGIDSRSQAQDAFPTEIDPNVTPAGNHYRPTTDRFGTCAFSMGQDLLDLGPHLVTGDSIWVQVKAQRAGGGDVTAVTWHGAIVRGPHTGKSPAPYTVGSNGFFSVDADSVRQWNGTALADFYFVSLDDTYFRGGDELHYFWVATDVGGGYSSDPSGLSAPPASVEEAQEATQGLHEVSYLPTIDWSASYLAHIQSDPHGDIDPTPQQIANSSQSHCLLYVNHIVSRRRSGDLNRTSFMYALDRLGYRGQYDVYDHQGMGNTNNHLGGRATIEQAQGYNLIVYDTGNGNPGRPLLPDGIDLDAEKIDQAGWFRAWLAQASLSEAGFATLWIVGSNVLEEKSGVVGSGGALLNTDMGVQLASTNQNQTVNPDVVGVAGFDFDQGSGISSEDFSGDAYRLNGGCPSIRSYDAAAVSGGTAVATHRYRHPLTSQLGAAAIVMNRNDAEAYNTILQTHPFFDIRDVAGTPASPPPELSLLSRILGAVLPSSCLQTPDPVDVGDDELPSTSPRTQLHPSVPNPFNPTTTIRFDLAESGPVTLRIFDVTGHRVRTLLDEERRAGRDHRIVWNGMDENARHVPSGIYFCRLEAGEARLTQKLIVMR